MSDSADDEATADNEVAVRENNSSSPKPLVVSVFNDEVDDYFEQMILVHDNLDYDYDTGRFYEDTISDDEDDDNDDNYDKDGYPKSTTGRVAQYGIGDVSARSPDSEKNRSDDQQNHENIGNVENLLNNTVVGQLDSAQNGNDGEGIQVESLSAPNEQSVASEDLQNSKVIYEADGTSYRILPRF